MPTRHHAPAGAPCWADLWTSDVEGSQRFYAEVFGWKADEPDPTHGGYFMFKLDGVPVAGAMGPMPDMPASNTWRPYLSVADAEATLSAAAAHGAEVVVPAMPVDQLGVQGVLTDPTGAPIGLWQPGEFAGFTVLGEDGAPSWFELHTPDYPTAVAFYREVFGWDTEVMSDTEQFRYTVQRGPDGDQLAGIIDVSAWGEPPHWSIYWKASDVDAALGRVTAAGGSVVRDAEDTPYGRLAVAADPAGAQFHLHAPNR